MEEEHKSATRPIATMDPASTSPVRRHNTRAKGVRSYAHRYGMEEADDVLMPFGASSLEAAKRGSFAYDTTHSVIDLSDETDHDAPISATSLDDTLLASVPSIGLLSGSEAATSAAAASSSAVEDDLNEVDDEPRLLSRDLLYSPTVDGDDDDDEREVNVNASPEGVTSLVASEESSSSSEYEVNEDPHCYCRLPWDGDEKMIECDACRTWFHFDCMGIPTSREFGDDEKWKCDACRASSGMPPNESTITRRNRRREVEKRKERSERRARARREKKAGISKEERAALRNAERLQRRKERDAANARQAKEATTGGLKSLLASFDNESSSSDSDSSSDGSSSADSIPTPKKKQVKQRPAAPAAATPAAPPTPTSKSNASVAKATPTTPVQKKSSVAPSPAPAPNKMAGLYGPIRAKVRAMFVSVLGAGLSESVESCLFRHHSSAGKAYLAQCRDILANLKDSTNDLKSRVLSGAVTPANLATMSSKDLASSELTQMREQIRKDAVKDAVRAVSPPRDKSMVPRDKSLIAADDTAVNEEVLQNAITGLQPREEAPTTSEIITSPRTPTTTMRPATAASKSTVNSSSLLASLPKLGSYEEVIESYQAAGETPKKSAASPKSSTSPKSAASSPAAATGPTPAEVRRAKRREILTAANAALAADGRKKSAETTHVSDDEVDPDAPPKTESVVDPKPKPSADKNKSASTTAATDSDEVDLLYQQLHLPPMDVWNGDLLLSAGANPSVLTNYFPLVARQTAGPPVLTLPLPSRIEESLRLKVEEVQKYVQLVAARGTKKLVLVEFDLNVGLSSGAATSTLREDYTAFCDNYVRKNRALAFDYQKDAEVTNRLLLYLIPPDTATYLTAEFVQKHLKASRPAGKMWGIVIMPRETYQPIAKRISRVHLKKMQAQAAAVERYNHAHAATKNDSSPDAAAKTATPAAAATTTIRPTDPRRPATNSAPPAAPTSSVAAGSTASAPAPADAKSGVDLAALLNSNPASLDYFSSLLTRLTGTNGATTATAGANQTPAPLPQATAPPPAPIAAFPPPPPPPAAAAFPMPPPPPPTQVQPYPNQFMPPPPQPDAHIQGGLLGKRPREDVAGDVAPPSVRKSRFGPDKPVLPPPPPPPPVVSTPVSTPLQFAPVGSRGPSGVCDFWFSARGCRKTNCNYSHDASLPAAQAIMRAKGVPPHLQGSVQIRPVQTHMQAPPTQQTFMPPQPQPPQQQQQHLQHQQQPPFQAPPPMQPPPQLSPPVHQQQQMPPHQFPPPPHGMPPQQNQSGIHPPQFAPPQQQMHSFPPPQAQQQHPHPMQQQHAPPSYSHSGPPPPPQHPGQQQMHFMPPPPQQPQQQHAPMPPHHQQAPMLPMHPHGQMPPPPPHQQHYPEHPQHQQQQFPPPPQMPMPPQQQQQYPPQSHPYAHPAPPPPHAAYPPRYM